MDYEMKENECYEEVNIQQYKKVSETTSSTSNKLWKCSIVIAILFNLVLVIGIGAVFFHYQIKTENEINELRILSQNMTEGGPANVTGQAEPPELTGPTGPEGPPGPTGS